MFCVSARDCHRIEGRLRAESKQATFSSVKQTEVPELRLHVHALTGAAYVMMLLLSLLLKQLSCG